jgi:DNA (cytosine-5)-methyltransferase 1
VAISADPLGMVPPPLTDFLLPGEVREPLSIKATLGFLNRTRRAKLRFEPGFIDAVERHLKTVGGIVPPRTPDRQLSLLAA